MLGTFVVLYLFLGGCGAAALGVTAVWSLLFAGTVTRTEEQTRAFAQVSRLLYGVGFLTVVAAALCLLFDLGRPERAFLLFVRPTPSLLSAGSFVLSGCLACGAALFGMSLGVGGNRVLPAVRRVLEALCALLAAVMLLYTGIYLAWLAVPLWNNPALPALLALSSLSSGLALVLLVASFGRDWGLLSGWAELLHAVHKWALLLEGVAFIVFVALAVLDPFAHASLALLFDAEGLRPWLFVGFLGMGLAVPLLAELLRALLPSPATVPIAEALCIAGGLILRFCLVMSGSH